ncbi:ABC transporter permease [Microvirga pudoricolor]|uniref:ABC transporter permease n=1 Tax=Microvirga pudoricolor TaxID=2778729 RepID=UPI0019526E26|nr:ABC transporter permease [Microvirga pudoricolor]MBM6593586.1 ABC transporter permease [Microvirga pudoricolor]
MKGFWRAIETTVAIAGIIAVWDLYTRIYDVPNFLLPSPVSVWSAFLEAAQGPLLGHLLHTVTILVSGYILGVLSGMASGLLLAKSERVERWLSGPILFLQTAPKIALAPLFVIWFGLGITSKLILIVSLVFFPVLIATLIGIRSVDRRLHDLARVLHLNLWQRFRRIEFPSALPEIFIGLRVGAVQAVVGAILAEWMSGKQGLGYLMTFATATYKTPLLFATVILTALLGIVVYQIIEFLERRLLSWRDQP